MKHTWQHIIADFYKVKETLSELTETKLKDYISEKLLQNNLTQLWNYYHTFNKKNEITCVVALAESHISIHTWPEEEYVSLDIFVCNLNDDNSNKAQQLYQDFLLFFSPGEVKKQIIQR